MLSCSLALQSTLYNNSAITDLVGEISEGVYAIFSSNPLPAVADGVSPAINHYMVTTHTATQIWTNAEFIINCWAKSELEAHTLQEAICSEYPDTWNNGYRYMASVMPLIPIDEDGGYYNAPVTMKVQAIENIV